MPEIFTEQQVKMRQELLIGIERAQQMPTVPLHSHEFIELAFIASGSALHFHNGRNGEIRFDGLIQGDLFSVQIGEQHSYKHCRNMVLYNLYLKPALLDRFRNLEDLPGWKLLFGERTGLSGKLIHLSPEERAKMVQCLEQILNEYRLMPQGYETMITALTTEFLVTVVRAAANWRSDFKDIYPGILESISMMEGAPEQHFSLEQLARFSHMCVASYTKKFRTATGLSPMEYLLNVRLQQVRHFLKTSDLSIAEIADRCGFCDANYLIKLFRRELGITPTRYRKENIRK